MELGQIVFGNPVGKFETYNYQDALILSLISEMETVYWNKNQKEWDRYSDPGFVGITFRPYYWGDNEEEAAKPNLTVAFSEQEIRWYKHPGRSMTVTLDWTPEQWADWYEKSYQLIWSNHHEKW